jgi:hypothetical protein
MNTTPILVIGGLGLGCATAGAIGFYLALSRPYRKVRNRLAIHFGQAFVLVFAVGGVLCTIPESQAEPDIRFLVAVAFAEPETLKGKLVTDTLHEMGQHIRRIIFDFDKRGLI